MQFHRVQGRLRGCNSEHPNEQGSAGASIQLAPAPPPGQPVSDSDAAARTSAEHAAGGDHPRPPRHQGQCSEAGEQPPVPALPPGEDGHPAEPVWQGARHC